MRKILLILVFTFSFLNASINEYQSDVYFANGIDTSIENAGKSKKKLYRKFKSSYPTEYQDVADWKVSYNHSYGMVLDLYESLLQKIYEDKVGSSLKPFIWNFKEVLGVFDYSFKELVTKIAKKLPKEQIKEYSTKLVQKMAKKTLEIYNKHGKNFTQEELELLFDAVFNDLIENGISEFATFTEEEMVQNEFNDLKTQTKAYIESVKNGHGVIVIAHSQGNLFTNRAYEMLASPLQVNNVKWMQKYFYVLGVATPANNVIGKNSPYITFDNDIIKLVPDSLNWNTTNPTRYYFSPNAEGEVVENIYSIKAHTFLSSYMKTEKTRKVMMDFIKGSIQKHKDADSQWSFTEELTCKAGQSCEESLQKVTHFEEENSQLYIGDKVYPFNKKGKIYQVGGEYVKASYGGVSINGGIEKEVCYELKDKNDEVIEDIKACEICPNPSIFEVISHQNENTKNWRVTVKNNETNKTTSGVYPFNLNGSLYKLSTGEDVIASCGGEYIQESWEGQEKDEVYRLEGTGEIIHVYLPFSCSSAYENGYQIMATYCSYSQSDNGRYWYKDRGFISTPASEKGTNWSSLTSKYNHCGVYSSGTISNWGGASPCFEAHVYWSKIPSQIETQTIKSMSVIPALESSSVIDNNSSL